MTVRIESSSPTQPRLEHMALWVEDIDRSAAFLERALGWRRHPLVFGVDETDTIYGGMLLAFVDANGFWIELVQPTTEGPGMEFLRQKGDGSLVELDFEVTDFDASCALMKSRGITLMGMDGNPLQQGGLLREWFLDEHGERQRGDELLSYLPADVAQGTSIELFWEYPTGVVIRRDRTWTDDQRTPRDAPRFDHTVVLAGDFEATLSVYTDILNLPHQAAAPGLERGWMGMKNGPHAWIRANERGNWISIVGADAHGGGRQLLEDSRLGPGAIVEIAAEVADIDAFSRRMAAAGITMTAGDDTPLDAGATSVCVDSSGDRYAYFSRESSEGMRIMVFQRGTDARSVFAARDR